MALYKNVPDFSLYFDEISQYFKSNADMNQKATHLIEHNAEKMDIEYFNQIPSKKSTHLSVKKLIQKKMVEEQFLDWVKNGENVNGSMLL